MQSLGTQTCAYEVFWKLPPSRTGVAWMTLCKSSHWSTSFLPNYVNMELSFFLFCFLFGGSHNPFEIIYFFLSTQNIGMCFWLLYPTIVKNLLHFWNFKKEIMLLEDQSLKYFWSHMQYVFSKYFIWRDTERAHIWVHRLLSQIDWGQIQGIYLVAVGLWAVYSNLWTCFCLP